jgi:putative ABC transport system permease protein
MIKNYFKVARRNLSKNKGYTFINVAGLAIAFATGILIFLAAAYQLSFDKFHADSDRIFQSYFNFSRKDGIQKSGATCYPFAPNLKTEYPEVERAARLMGVSGSVRVNGRVYDAGIQGTDEDLLQIFSFTAKRGDKTTALNGLSNITINESMAKKVFGAENPMGKTIQVRKNLAWENFIVTAVLADMPDNSSIKPEALVRIENAGNYTDQKDYWENFNHNTYIKLKKGADAAQLCKKAQTFLEKYFTESIALSKKTGGAPDKDGRFMSMGLLPLKDFHHDNEVRNGGASKASIYALMSVAVFILLIAGFNFVNLSIALSLSRAREMGVRKSLGAKKNQLFLQLLGESFIVFFAGWIIGFVAAYILIVQVAKMIQTKLNISSVFEPKVIAWQFVGFIIITLLAGGYPAWLISKFNAVEVLKGKISLKRPGFLRNSIIITQFAIACLLIFCTIVVFQQKNFLLKKPVGFNNEQIVSIPVGSEVSGNTVLEKYRQALANQPGIVSVTGTDVNIGRGLDNSTSGSALGFEYEGKSVNTNWLRVDFDYLKALNIPLLQGRDFNRDFSTDTATAVIINQSMADMMGEKDAVGKFLQPDTAGAKLQIIGVVADFHLYALDTKIPPLTMHLFQGQPVNYVFVKLQPGYAESGMTLLKNEWRNIAPNSLFKASFMDVNMEQWFRQDKIMAVVFTIASAIAIGLSCMGLFGIAWLIIQQRTKEIGVRKVLGATVSQISMVLCKDFVKLVLIALLIATPLAWLMMNKFLEGYAYRIHIQWWVFALTGMTGIGIALLTVSYQSIKAALMNPVKSLKAE